MDRKASLTLKTFVDQLNNHVSKIHSLTQANALAIITYVRDFTYSKFIKVSHEHLSCLDRCDEEGVPRAFRLVLATKRNRANFGIPLVRESNGAVIMVEQTIDAGGNENISARILTRPACDCNPKIQNPHAINTSIRNGMYDIYFIEDGTTINISYVARTPSTGEWVFSSKNSFDLKNITWRGRRYGDVLEEVMTEYPDFSLDRLSKHKTYTIGFRHPDFHPFRGDPTIKAWFIQSTDLRTGLISTESIGLPTQERTKISAQGGKFWQAMQNTAQNAFKQFKAGSCKRPFFGYILRSRDRGRTRHYSDILIESSLLSEIRRAIYQPPYIANKAQLAAYKQNFKDMHFVIVEGYLNPKKRPVFEVLFPQYIDEYHRFDEIVDEAVDSIYQLLKTDPHGNNWEPQPEPTTNDKMVMTFAPIAADMVSTDADSATVKKLIRTTIVRHKYTDKYVQIF